MVNNNTYGWRLIKKACPMSEASASPKAPTFGGYGEIVDVFLQKRRDGAAAKRFFKRLLKKHRDDPGKIVTDKLRSYGVAHRELIPDTILLIKLRLQSYKLTVSFKI
jgi:hypothetical protein